MLPSIRTKFLLVQLERCQGNSKLLPFFQVSGSVFFFDEVVKAIASGKNKKKYENRVVDLRTDGTYRRHPLI
jgi:hypothetical protein